MVSQQVADWFERASVGLFVHWGISSVHGEVDLSWGMVEDKPWGDGRSIDPEEYWALADEFDPDAYDPDRWLRAAREAGMEYAVLTARHHDGFALWPSEFGEFSTKQHLDRRDLVGEYVDACRRQGLKVGLYYSGPDWYHPDFPVNPGSYGGPEMSAPESVDGNDVADFETYFGYVKGQVGELATRYGDLDLFWFDGSPTFGPVDRGPAELYDLLRSENPGIVVNDRGDEHLGDYYTPEVELPERPMDGPWELCQTWAGQWGYAADESFPDLDWTLERLATTVGRGGNLLLNVGPRPDGDLSEAAYERLAELAVWMDANEPAVRDVEGGPFPPRADVPITRRDNTWYIHALAGHERVAVDHVTRPRDVRLLRNGARVSYTFDDGTLEIDVPASTRASPDEVVAVTWDHPTEGEYWPLKGRPE
jgi:alpha-L-fucosidase